MMWSTLAKTILVSIVGSVAVLAQNDVPDEPFAVYVFTDVPGADDETIAETTEEVAKQIEKRKKWFTIVTDRDDADLAVEVLDQGRANETTSDYTQRRDNRVVGDGNPTTFVDVKKVSVLYTRVFVPRGEPILMETSGDGRPKDAAEPFARNLERFCRLNYETLMKALGR